MSHAVTVSVEVTDAATLKAALGKLNLGYQEKGSNITLTGKKLYGNDVVFHLDKGTVTKDYMSSHTELVNQVFQQYQVEKAMYQALQYGHTVESQETLSDGTIRIV